MGESGASYVSRGGYKLAAALDAFGIDVTGMVCADLGCNVGGFTDCLLQHGAARVYAVDTGYGALAWKLRQDPRVVVLERTNAMHFDPWKDLPTTADAPKFEGCGLVAVDLGWTRQVYAVPAARKWLIPPDKVEPGKAPPRIVTLIKPHYEAGPLGPHGAPRSTVRRGVLDGPAAEAMLQKALAEFAGLGVQVRGHIKSPIRGGASRGIAGNVEYLAVLEPA